jgi:hypothetical protein
VEYKIGKYRGKPCVYWYDDEKVRRRFTLKSISDDELSKEAAAIYEMETSGVSKDVAGVEYSEHAKITDIEYLKECLNYDPLSGNLEWKDRPLSHFRSTRGWRTWNSRYSKKTAGFESEGYIHLRILGKNWRAHRIAWAIYHGTEPKTIIDHRNGDGTDNRLENLRDVSHIQNNRNAKRFVTNTSGRVGVSWHTRYQQWCAYIGFEGKILFLGQFDNKQEAIKAREAAELKYEYDPNHGKR